MKAFLALAFLLPVVALANGAYSTGSGDWHRLKNSQNPPCAPEFDSQEILRGHTTEFSILILHGYGQSPEGMREYIDYFRRFDVNILAPRLAGHYNEDLSDLDRITYPAWEIQTERSFQAARKLGRRVVIVGYSLGGLVGSEMALRHPGQVAALVLLSPAWRLRSSLNFLTDLGQSLHINANALIHRRAQCDLNDHYYSPNAGRQVEALEHALDGVNLHDVSHSVFARIQAPTLVAVVQHDRVVDSKKVAQIFTPRLPSRERVFLTFPGRSHGLLARPPKDLRPSEKYSATPLPGAAIFEQIGHFLGSQIGFGR